MPCAALRDKDYFKNMKIKANLCPHILLTSKVSGKNEMVKSGLFEIFGEMKNLVNWKLLNWGNGKVISCWSIAKTKCSSQVPCSLEGLIKWGKGWKGRKYSATQRAQWYTEKIGASNGAASLT